MNAEVIELQNEREMLEEDIDRTKEQVERAKREFAATGEPASRDWFAKANRALRVKRRQSQTLLAMIGDARRKQKRAEAWALESIFMDVVRESVNDDQFSAYLGEAKRRYDLK